MIVIGKKYRGYSPEHAKAVDEGRAPLGVFRTPEGVFSGYWDREYPASYIAGQGDIMWMYEAASDSLAEKVGV